MKKFEIVQFMCPGNENSGEDMIYNCGNVVHAANHSDVSVAIISHEEIEEAKKSVNINYDMPFGAIVVYKGEESAEGQEVELAKELANW